MVCEGPTSSWFHTLLSAFNILLPFRLSLISPVKPWRLNLCIHHFLLTKLPAFHDCFLQICTKNGGGPKEMSPCRFLSSSFHHPTPFFSSFLSLFLFWNYHKLHPLVLRRAFYPHSDPLNFLPSNLHRLDKAFLLCRYSILPEGNSVEFNFSTSLH